MNTPALRIACTRPGLWRAGIQHPAGPVDHPAGAFTEEQIEQLLAEPALVVDIVGEARGAEPPSLTSAQIARLRELTPEELDSALAPPTVQAALDAALSAMGRATADEAGKFFQGLEASGWNLASKLKLSRQERLVEAIGELEPGDDAHWTKSGLPEVRALQAATGLEGVSASERDAAWEAHLEAAG